MKKILISLVAVLGIICLGKQPVLAATYTQDEIINGANLFQAGDILQFDNPVTVTINNIDGQNIFKQNSNTVTLPSYPQEMKSFKGWIHAGTFINETTHTTTVLFKPYLKPEIIVNEVIDGESITLSVPENQIPFAAGTYTTEWIVGGMGGGIAIEEAPKNSLTWTIPATSNEYKNGAIFALRIANAGNHVFSEEAVLVIKPKEAVANPDSSVNPIIPVDTTVKPEQPKKKVVATADIQPIFVNVLLIGVAIGLTIMLRKKSIQ